MVNIQYVKILFNIKHNADISKYPKLMALLKKQTEHHCPKKSQILDDEHITTFLINAPNKEYLLMKVIIFYLFERGPRI
jgi:hypothetical protein